MNIKLFGNRHRIYAIICLAVIFALVLLLSVNVEMFAIADTINGGFTQNEINIALNNLYCKFESAEERPIFENAEVIYDFNEQPLYALYIFDDYYMIVIRSTGTILERGEGVSKFEGMQGKKYYGQFFESFQKIDGVVYDSNNNVIDSDTQNDLMLSMQNIRELDYADYLEAMQYPQTRGASNRGNITKLGHSDSKYNYFARDINIYYQRYNDSTGYLRSQSLNKTSSVNIDKVLYYIDGMSHLKYGLAYYREFANNEYDMFYPQNVYNACSLVTMTMLLQYYDRNGINTNLIADSITYSTNIISITDNPIRSKAERIMQELYPELYRLDGFGDDFDGAATYYNINGAFDRYFEKHNINCEPVYFTSYTNVKGAIDSGNPVIITVGAGRGFYKQYGSGSYSEVNLSGHNVVAYGYTKNGLGILDEFIVHANWHNGGNNYAQVYMNKLYAAGNCYLDVL